MLPFYEVLAGRFDNLFSQLHDSLDSLPLEALGWIPGPEMNSVTVLMVHSTGAARFLVGDVVMHDPSNRNRDAEFQAKGMTTDALNRRLDDTQAYIKAAFEKLSLEDLAAERAHPREGKVTVAWALLHALDHLGVHLGHVQITAQLWHQQFDKKK